MPTYRFNNTALSYFVPKNERVNQFSCDAWAFGAQMVGINYYNAKRGKGYSTEEIQEGVACFMGVEQSLSIFFSS